MAFTPIAKSNRPPVVRITEKPARQQAIEKFQKLGFDISPFEKNPLQAALSQLQGLGILGGGGGGTGSGSSRGSSGFAGAGAGGSLDDFLKASREAQTSRIKENSANALNSSLADLSARGLGSSSLGLVARQKEARNQNQDFLNLEESLTGKKADFDKALIGRSPGEQLLNSLLGGIFS